MEARLVEAAATGNVDVLGRLMSEDMMLLDSVALLGTETPLHIASMRGHIAFVQEMLKLKKEFAYELNQDGFTPLHLASACGHVHVVLELLKVDQNLCTISGKEGRLALHCAALKGRIDVMKALLSASPPTVETKTARGDTPLHIAVKNNQFHAFRSLLEHAKEFKMEGLVLNDKDNQGNTVLHVAASRKQYQVINLLLVDDDVAKGVIEVNSLNKREMSPLDVLMLFESEAGDLEIQTVLLEAGAKRGKDMIIISSPTPGDISNNNIGQSSVLEINIHDDNPASDILSKRMRYWPRYDEIRELFGYKHNKESRQDVRTILLTIAALMTTATYQAVLSPPGGVWQDDDGHTAGKSIMGTKSAYNFWAYILGNSLGFFTSLYMIGWLTIDFPLQYSLLLLMFCMSFNYTSSITCLVPDGYSHTALDLTLAFCYLVPLIPSLFRWLKLMIDRSREIFTHS